MDAPPNSYSAAWFGHFHREIPEMRTERETAFVAAQCPQASFPRILDVCCGMGRHARALAALGYQVTAVERDAEAVAAARDKAGGPVYIHADVRTFRTARAEFDAVIILSQSFGYFDAATNGNILAALADGLRTGGRMILDLWNPAFFRTRTGEHRFEHPAGTVRETKQMEGDRLRTRLDYPDGGSDSFDFQTFPSEQMAAVARPAGLELIAACRDFTLSSPPCPDHPKVQYLLQRL